MGRPAPPPPAQMPASDESVGGNRVTSVSVMQACSRSVFALAPECVFCVTNCREWFAIALLGHHHHMCLHVVHTNLAGTLHSFRRCAEIARLTNGSLCSAAMWRALREVRRLSKPWALLRAVGQAFRTPTSRHRPRPGPTSDVQD